MGGNLGVRIKGGKSGGYGWKVRLRSCNRTKEFYEAAKEF